MIYKIILGKSEVLIGEEDRDKIINNIGKNFIVLSSGEVVNPSFIQGIIIDHEATRQHVKEIKAEQNFKELNAPRESGDVSHLLEKYKPSFLK